MRILICEDSALLREGLVRVLEDAGHEVVAALPDASHLDETVDDTAPDLCILDVRLPPTWVDEGIRAALALRARLPKLAVLVLSQYVEERYAADLIASSGGALGYLLKDRVADVTEFLEAIQRIASGATVLDPEVVAQLQGGLTPFGEIELWPWAGLIAFDAARQPVATLPSLALVGLMLILSALCWVALRLAARR